MKKSDIFWQTYLNLEKETLEVSKYIFFTDEVTTSKNGCFCSKTCDMQLKTFSPYIADLLICCCVQIEAISKEIYFENGGSKKRGDSHVFFDEDCLKLINSKWHTDNKTVLVVAPSFNFTKKENNVLFPLKNAFKRKGTFWERAYQAVKHDRYLCLPEGNVKALIHSLAALYLLNLYYRKDSWITALQNLSKHDYGMGSKIFAVKAPSTSSLLWEENKPEESESPYVATFQDEEYQKMQKIRDKEVNALNNYLLTQPELRESGFKTYMDTAIERAKKDPTRPVLLYNEIYKYRLNKKISPTLSFEDRKKMLLNSKEWNYWKDYTNSKSTGDEITEDNIQDKIDELGSFWGTKTALQYNKLTWANIGVTKEICHVYIPYTNGKSS